MAPLGLTWVAPLALVGVHSYQGANQQWHLRATLPQPGAQVSCLLGCRLLGCHLLGCCLCCCPLHFCPLRCCLVV